MVKTFNVGDRVRVKKTYNEWTAGLTGTVVHEEDALDGEYLIAFSEEDADGRGHGENNNEWWMGREDLKAATKTPKGPQAYKGNGKHEWELVVDTVARLRVPGGWLYRDGFAEGMTFVPVPDVVGYEI